jgi:hypothetical protein
VRRLIILLILSAVFAVPSDILGASGERPRRGYFTTETGEISLMHSDAARTAARTDLAAGVFASRCKRVWAARVYRNIFGTVLWKYFQQQAFCYNGVRVTSLYDWRRWPELRAPGWSFKGHIARAVTGRAGSWHYGTWTQGRFRLCWAWCIEERLPWVDLDVYGNGAWSHRTGGT